MKVSYIYQSPIGEMLLQGEDDFLIGLDFLTESNLEKDSMFQMTEIVEKCITQLDQYFQGKRKIFDLPYQLEGTEFRKKVWKELANIPYGETASYKDIAIKVGNPKAVRAVGGANHNNKIGIILPCHRVIGANGSMTGYGGGIWRKEWLLAFEKEIGKTKS